MAFKFGSFCIEVTTKWIRIEVTFVFYFAEPMVREYASRKKQEGIQVYTSYQKSI